MKSKWNIELGPRLIKPVEEIIKRLESEHNTFVELLGQEGNPESEKRYVLSSPFSGVQREEVTLAIAKLRNEFETITSKNKEAFLVAALAAYKELAAQRPVHDKRISQIELQEREERNAKANAAQEAQGNKAAECWRILESIKPANATALIVAEERINDSDVMTDYFGSHAGRKVAIGWRTGSREDFRQLRAAASLFPETANYGPGKNRYQVWPKAENEYDHAGGAVLIKGEALRIYGTEEEAKAIAESERAKLQAQWEAGLASGKGAASSMSEHNFMKYGFTLAKSDIEHRENYSMGSGNYLGDSKYSGWIVKSYELKYSGNRSEVLETEYLVKLADSQKQQFQNAPRAAKAEAVEQPTTNHSNEDVTVSKNEEKNGVEIRFAKKPTEDVLTVLKQNGFRWSKFSSVWYKSYSLDSWNFAQKVAAMLAPSPEQAVA